MVIEVEVEVAFGVALEAIEAGVEAAINQIMVLQQQSKVSRLDLLDHSGMAD